MQDFTIALVAHESPVGEKQRNLDATIAWCRKAKRRGADLVLFPELNITGHAGCAAMVEQAEPVPGPSTDALVEVARELNIHICAGICEDQCGIHYNTQFIVGPDGYVGKQRKVHLSNDEYFYFRAGTALPVYDLPFARVGMIICYDNIIPEVSRCLSVDGAEVLLCPHAARSGKWRRTAKQRAQLHRNNLDSWAKVHRARAYDNGCYVALCNTTGRSSREVDANHAGGCMAVDPHGEIITKSTGSDIREQMLVVPMPAKPVIDRRKASCFNLQTRKVEVFGSLTRPTD